MHGNRRSVKKKCIYSPQKGFVKYYYEYNEYAAVRSAPMFEKALCDDANLTTLQPHDITV